MQPRPDPLVSVLVATHDVAPWLAEALGSALAQSLTDLEVVVVDDASTDASPRIAEQLAARDPRLRVVRRAINRGSAATRNEALALARGRWVAVLDGDDRMALDRLARLVAAAESEGADWIADDQWIEPRDGGRPGRLLLDEPPGVSQLDIPRLLDRDPPETIGYGTLKPLVRRAFLERHGIRWRPEAGRSDDLIFALECLAAGARGRLLNEPLYHYRLRAGSQVHRLDPLATLAHMFEVQALAERLLAGHPDPAVAAALARRRARLEAALGYLQAIEAIRRGAPRRLLALLRARPALAALLVRGGLEAAGRRLRGERVPTLANRRLFRSIEVPDG